MAMKILIAHNRYRPTALSGEDAVVDQESSALSSRGHDVVPFQRHSAEIATWSSLQRGTLPVRLLWSRNSHRAITKSLIEFAPDVVHIHNIFPLITRSILYACRDANVPVVATLHNGEVKPVEQGAKVAASTLPHFLGNLVPHGLPAVADMSVLPSANKAGRRVPASHESRW
jgi:Glycosyltransferase Family 4